MERTATAATPPRPTQKKFFPPVLALGLLAIAGVAAMPFLGEVGMAGDNATGSLGRWVGFLGGFHPLFLHLPIGVLALVVAMEACRFVTRGKYTPRTTLALAFASGMAVFAAAFGHCLYLTGDFPSEIAREHKRDGTLFTILLGVTFLVKYAADVYPLARALKPGYALGLLLSTAAMISTGHHGGEITHGDPFGRAPWIPHGKKTPAADPVIYTDVIHPILEAKCIKCHGPKKQKGDLRMDSYQFLLDGGGETDCLVPGDLEKSAMISYLHLPLDDDLRMPPEGKPQLTAEEIRILEWWVQAGAPETARKSGLATTPAVERALTSWQQSAPAK